MHLQHSVNQKIIYHLLLLLFSLVSHLNAIDHEFKIKVQELRLYETVLTQRIHAIKSIANDTSIPDIK
ncbi:unnamed protein product, partial [Rotaria sp. Silwood2]